MAHDNKNPKNSLTATINPNPIASRVRLRSSQSPTNSFRFCLYEVSYGERSYTVSEFVTETVTLDVSTVSDVAIGCGHNNEGQFVGITALLDLY